MGILLELMYFSYNPGQIKGSVTVEQFVGHEKYMNNLRIRQKMVTHLATLCIKLKKGLGQWKN